MFKKYEGKHFEEKSKLKCFSIIKLFVTIVAIIGLTFSPIARILSYYIDVDTCVNSFSLEGTYTILYRANGGIGIMQDREVFCSQSINLDLNTFERSGFEFAGWNTDPGGAGTSYSDGQSVSNLAAANSTITLYAQWSEGNYEAEIVGGSKYETIQEAVNAAGTGATVRALKNIVLTSAVNVSNNKNIILDIQNYTLSNANNLDINIIKNSGTLEIISGTIHSNAPHGAIDNESSGRLKVSGGQIIATGERQAIYNAGGTVEVTGTAYLSSSASDRATIQNFKPNNANAGTVTISGGTIISTTTTSKGAVQNEATGTVVVTGGSITSNNAIGIDNSGTLILGVQDDDIDITDPVIQGATYGVKTAGNGTVEFYDGIVKGQTNAFNDESYITEQEDNSIIQHSSEVISGNTYETAYLEMTGAKITFDGNGGTPAETIMFVPYNTAIGTLPNNPTWTHYSFDGWYTDPSGGTQVTASTVVTDSTRYYAHWTKVEAEVQFDAGDGTSSENLRVVNIGSEVGPLPTATQQYKTFVGWFTSDSGGIQIDEHELINDDITYYAHWDSIPVVATFDPGTGGSVSEPTRNLYAGDTLGSGGALPIPTCPGMYFAGWYTDPNAGDRIDENTLITEDTDYYAHWISSAVARIGSIYYETLQDAINDVPTDNTQTTITLLKNDLEAVSILNTNKNIILDLNGYQLYNNGSKKAHALDNNDFRPSVIENLGTLKIMNGTITTNSSQAAVNTGTGSVIIEDVTITHTGTSGKNTKQAVYVYSGTVLIKGNTVISANNSGTYGGYDRGAVQNAGGEVTITGGTITSTVGPAIVNQANATTILGIEDGTIGNTTPAIQGKTYGVKTSGANSAFNFFDGIVKGQTDSISGSVAGTESGATRVDTTDGTYSITYYE